MDRLGDLNLINASPVCSQGHVPFCQDIRLCRTRLLDSPPLWVTRREMRPGTGGWGWGGIQAIFFARPPRGFEGGGGILKAISDFVEQNFSLEDSPEGQCNAWYNCAPVFRSLVYHPWVFSDPEEL